MRPVAGVAVVVVLVVAACGGGDDAEPVPTDVAVGTTSPPSTAPTTTEPTPVTTEPATPTTVDETAALIADIEADLNAGEQTFLHGAATPASEESRGDLERYFADEALETLLSFYDLLDREGLVARPSTSTPSTIEVLRVMEQRSPADVVVEYCRIDAGVVVDRLANGGEAVVDDSITRYDTIVQLRLVDGVWVLPGGGDVTSELPGVATCA